jgi:integrase
MPREKKQRLKKRADGYYVCRYKDQWFYSLDPDEPLAMRDEYKRLEKQALLSVPTVEKFADKWISRAYPSVAQTTKAQLKIHLKKLTDSIGVKLLTDVKPSDIKQIYSEKYLGMSKSYISAGKQLFCSLFDSAVADGYLRVNPARDKTAKPHKGTTGSHRQITPEERSWIETLCTDHRAHPAVMAMLYAGIRPQEMKAVLIERDVDFKAETITLHEFAHIQDSNHYQLTKKGKTDQAARTIPLFPPLKKALSGRKGRLITSAKGNQVTIQAWRSAWESYVVCMETAINGCQKRWYGRTREHKSILDAGGKLPPWRSFTVVPYDLRHSFCCMCRDADPPVELHTCVRWMGHKDAKMIMRIYDEASDDRSEKEAERIKKTLFRSGNGSIKNPGLPET